MAYDIVNELHQASYHDEDYRARAAREIDRLRAENERLRARAAREIDRLRAENERLRAALREYGDHTYER